MDVNIFDKNDSQGSDILLDDLLKSGLGEYTLPKDLPDEEMDEEVHRLQDSALNDVSEMETTETVLYAAFMLHQHRKSFSIESENPEEKEKKKNVFVEGFRKIIEKIMEFFTRLKMFFQKINISGKIKYLEGRKNDIKNKFSKNRDLYDVVNKKYTRKYVSLETIIELINTSFRMIDDGEILELTQSQADHFTILHNNTERKLLGIMPASEIIKDFLSMKTISFSEINNKLDKVIKSVKEKQLLNGHDGILVRGSTKEDEEYRKMTTITRKTSWWMRINTTIFTHFYSDISLLYKIAKSIKK